MEVLFFLREVVGCKILQVKRSGKQLLSNLTINCQNLPDMPSPHLLSFDVPQLF
jgi:hypothetical protein